MAFDSIVWDVDDDPDGNVRHCAEHGASKEEVEEVFQSATDADVSRSSGRPVVFGDTRAGRHLMVVYEEFGADTAYPVTPTKFPGGSGHEAHDPRPPADPGRGRHVAAELPDLIARHHERVAALDQVDELLKRLKAAREEKGLSLADLTGMDRSALSKLETGQRPNPTVETLVRYSDAVGKRLVVSLTDA
jgi:uncharacterized DUF497 family protein/DNA-binding XRE family transcriptional regulator